MAPNVEQSNFFREKRDKGIVVVKDPPKFDLESYIANYDGTTRLNRLHHIGASSTYLAIDAYHTAIAEAKRGKNVKLYLSLVEDLSNIAPDDPAALSDMAWAEKKSREVKEEQDKLEHELKAYKNNLIKESIRMGNEDLGHFYYACGDWVNAHKAYYRMRDHCTSNKHLTDMTLRLVFVSIAQGSWLGVQTNLAKVDSSQLKGDERTKLEPIISACHGLAQMCTNSLRDAAKDFIRTPPLFLTAEPAAGITWQREVLSGNDIAVYGGLCALASMDRNELQSQVLGSGDFRNFLELEPQIRRAITLFCNSKYSACLEVLEGYRNDYLLDVYLSKVLATIYSRIRTKSIVQYFIPFSCVTLDEMALKFQVTGEFASIEDELEEMINSRILNARIDLVDRLLISPPTNPRYDVHSDALSMAEKYDHTLRLRLTRLNLLSAGLEIRSDKGQGKELLGGAGEGIGASLRGIGSKMGFQ
ncbi:PCI-domain-containing protein [Melanomma pulvis-pyrius CBS 109.77]|uniref:COP9 signalosome complex subunit 1 n=1 Tax=Melanomma pulvis-pyrius CBS 109.77 TaxID=1314802 RepID=A0A6A6WZE8_9PLEO|nr:PCI-domain-containing protein [Melanomma pulvis-pyrius CBS 109.77]